MGSKRKSKEGKAAKDGQAKVVRFVLASLQLFAAQPPALISRDRCFRHVDAGQLVSENACDFPLMLVVPSSGHTLFFRQARFLLQNPRMCAVAQACIPYYRCERIADLRKIVHISFPAFS